MDQHETVFREEARELLTELESSLLELEKYPSDNELISKIFRAMHTIKGSGAMFGFDKVAAFTHDIETVYDLLRNGKITVSKELIDLTLASCDQIRLMIEGQEETEAAAKLTISFKEFLPGAKGTQAIAEPLKPEASAPPPAEVVDKKVTYRIRFKPHNDIFSRGTNITPLLMEMRRMGVCKITTQTDAVPDLAEINPENCYIYWDIMLTTNRGLDAVKDVFIFVEDECDLKIEAVDEAGTDEENEYKRLGEILIERGDVSRDVVEKLMADHEKIGEKLVAEGFVAADKVQSALAEQQHIQEMREKTKATDSGATIRVPAVRLDRLVNMVGELVTVQSRLSQLSAQVNDADLILVAEEVERLTAELRDNTMSIRMMPIGNTFSNFKRLVRDLSEELGKKISLETEGAETELDKTVIEKLNDPLIHLIRNSIDHGIEQPSVREQKGKPIKDDGAGIDPDAIRSKAIERNIISQSDNLTEKELFALIFAPGFSMAKTVTNVSGRGVGMDVVKKGIDGLKGTIDIASKVNEGTTITLKLPLTLAIIDGLLVRIAESFFVLPLAAIEECVELTREDVAKSHDRNIVHIRGEVVPYIPLRERFGISGDCPAIEQVIINRVGEERFGLVVDEVIGQHQTVIKTLGSFYKQISEVSGATILGDGTVALIIDITQLVQGAISEAP